MENTLLKSNTLKNHFIDGNLNSVMDNMGQVTRSKKRLLVRKGPENIVLLLEEIVLIFTQNTIVFVFDHCLKKYTSDKPMNELEALLPCTIFFRANRQYIINVNFVKSFRMRERVKLQVNLNIPDLNHTIVVSQRNAQNFKRWLQEG